MSVTKVGFPPHVTLMSNFRLLHYLLKFYCHLTEVSNHIKVYRELMFRFLFGPIGPFTSSPCEDSDLVCPTYSIWEILYRNLFERIARTQISCQCIHISVLLNALMRTLIDCDIIKHYRR